jgi:hypothetical protein
MRQWTYTANWTVNVAPTTQLEIEIARICHEHNATTEP